MLSILPTIANSTRKSTPKPVRLGYVIFVLLALILMASPGFAASASPQSLQLSQAPDVPKATCPPDGQCFADVPASNPFYLFVNRIYQQDLVSGYACGGVGEPCDAYLRPYYRPVADVTRQQMAKFIDEARRKPGIYIDTGNPYPIYARSTAANGVSVWGSSTNDNGIGVWGYSSHNFGVGVKGSTTVGIGVLGESNSVFLDDAGVKGTNNASGGTAVRGISTSGKGVYGTTGSGDGVGGYSASGDGIYGSACISCGGRAGFFQGNVAVTGNLSKGGGSFKIDHPLDPANKYLYHSFVESPDMMNVYNGNITTDAKGEAVVDLPEWFETLNRDFRYQLTILGDQFAQARISSKIKNNSFTIMTDKPNVEVSWQVTGIRQDPYANNHRIPVEEDKPADEQGKYLHPTEWDQPASSGIDSQKQQQMQQATEGTQSQP